MMFFFLQFVNIEVQESHAKNTDFFFLLLLALHWQVHTLKQTKIMLFQT